MQVYAQKLAPINPPNELVLEQFSAELTKTHNDISSRFMHTPCSF
jgi:hypothetical protein